MEYNPDIDNKKIKYESKYTWKDGKEAIPRLVCQGEMEYFRFPKLEETGVVRHLFSTRTGGVSRGEWTSLNLSFTRGDEREAVEENFKRVATVLGCTPSDMVSTDQTHTDRVRVVTKEDAGHGITREKDFFDTDGLITKEPGIVLSAFFADCVPLYFVDPVKKVIGLSHSGWKGTLKGIGEVTIQKMAEEFGSAPKDIIVAIGPSICQDCYEVSEDVKTAFEETFWPRYYSSEGCFVKECKAEAPGVVKGSKEESNRETDSLQAVFYDKGNGKYQLNLWFANELVLKKAGILPEHLEVTGICTCCNKEKLFSHRGSQGRRGNLGAFLGLL